jgi:hypothetical protein
MTSFWISTHNRWLVFYLVCLLLNSTTLWECSLMFGSICSRFILFYFNNLRIWSTIYWTQDRLEFMKHVCCSICWTKTLLLLFCGLLIFLWNIRWLFGFLLFKNRRTKLYIFIICRRGFTYYFFRWSKASFN